jgi:hypothetical protein
VLKAKQHVFLERDKSIYFANKNKMFLVIKWKKYLFLQANHLEID